MNRKLFGITLCVFLLLSVLSFRASCQAPTSGTIVAGHSVAGVKLGASLADFNSVFPKHPEFDESDDYHECGSSYHWLDIDFRANGIYAYLRHDRIFQLRDQIPRFSLGQWS